ESVRILRDLAGSWRPGERRSWRWTRHLPPYLEIGLQGTVALKKIGTTEKRAAAEFEFQAAGDGEDTGAPVRFTMTGRCWIDLATGFALETRISSRGDFSRSGAPVHVEITEEQRLDVSQSRGL